MEKSNTETNKPVYTDRRGRMKLAVFANSTPAGTRYSSEITRSWKEESASGQAGFQSTHRLDEQDLLNCAKLAHLADDWIAAQRRHDRG